MPATVPRTSLAGPQTDEIAGRNTCGFIGKKRIRVSEPDKKYFSDLKDCHDWRKIRA